jgi:hypothetical protein
MWLEVVADLQRQALSRAGIKMHPGLTKAAVDNALERAAKYRAREAELIRSGKMTWQLSGSTAGPSGSRTGEAAEAARTAHDPALAAGPGGVSAAQRRPALTLLCRAKPVRQAAGG